MPRYRAETAIYCSKECLNSGQWESITKICEGCGKEFKVSNSRVHQKYCSETCKSIKAMDAKEIRRRQKISSANSRGYGSTYLRKKTLELHDNKCIKCGYNDYIFNLDVHHKNCNPNDNSDENRTILCVICHRILHHKYKGDYNKFMKEE